MKNRIISVILLTLMLLSLTVVTGCGRSEHSSQGGGAILNKSRSDFSGETVTFDPGFLGLRPKLEASVTLTGYRENGSKKYKITTGGDWGGDISMETYDAKGRLMEEFTVDPESGRVYLRELYCFDGKRVNSLFNDWDKGLCDSYSYYDNGLVESRWYLSKGKSYEEDSFEYDEEGRCTLHHVYDHRNGEYIRDIISEYDENGHLVNYRYSPVDESNLDIYFEYDGCGNVERAYGTQPGLHEPEVIDCTYQNEYDADGRLVSRLRIEDDDAREIDVFNYDAQGRLRAYGQWEVRNWEPTELRNMLRIDYDENGNVTRLMTDCPHGDDFSYDLDELETRGMKELYLERDENGELVRLVSYDSSGERTETYSLYGFPYEAKEVIKDEKGLSAEIVNERVVPFNEIPARTQEKLTGFDGYDDQSDYLEVELRVENKGSEDVEGSVISGVRVTTCWLPGEDVERYEGEEYYENGSSGQLAAGKSTTVLLYFPYEPDGRTNYYRELEFTMGFDMGRDRHRFFEKNYSALLGDRNG